ncbi:sialate O-acetylesterase-like isoform X2 [Ruditapes philippinarum]|uniref:sialate O-acetylesterase-like isoform X2 n=1 Tax=Ruditapes philippinarum TaxID=129788 RepID=UPI00295BFA04|nr:sialate O-acetylesterase-like isoform X2 [Ruditapes philippinarum]
MEPSVILLVTACLTVGIHGTLRMPNYYSDHMVLQRAPARAILWGYADVIGDTVNIIMNGVKIEQTTVQRSTKNGTEGFWKVKLPAQTSPGPHAIQVNSSEGMLTFVNVMFGDVWICSGQSNMQFSMREVFNSTYEIDNSIQYNNIRMMFSDFVRSNVPLDDVSLKHSWKYPVKGTIDSFSALCFMFARDLQKHLKYPIGVIESDWGGTPIEVWSGPDAIKDCPSNFSFTPKYVPTERGVLWNSMIHPYLSMTIKGAIWYQGESNSGHPDLYACQFPAMIDDWRKKFHAGSDGETSDHFPFGFVQLAPNRAGSAIGGFPPTRWAQTTNVGYVPNSNMSDTFMAVAVDLPDFNSPSGSIHPTYKQDVAARLVLGAMNAAYGDKSVVFQGPFPTEYKMNNGRHVLNITFDNGTGSLHINNNNGFEICCSSTTSGCNNQGAWVPAPIKVSEKSNVQIDTSGCYGNNVTGVRYLWRESPCALKQCALYDSRTQLPVPPFIKIKMFKTSGGNLRMPKYYGNHMVLQRAPARAILWGYADVIGDTVSVLMNDVKIAETTVRKSTKNGTVGIWKVKLPAQTSPGPHEIQVESSEGFLSFVDVMFGDVWICSGQSNMQFTMREVFNSTYEIDDSIKYGDIRMLFSDFKQSNVPLDDVSLKRPWIYPIKGIINEFSALCFMFARDLQKRLKYPIGVIESDWGGTPIEVWSGPDVFQACPSQSTLTPSMYWPTERGVLWNSMIHPYLSMTIKGAIWYQGESNAGRPDLYACQFPAMIDDWRKKFHAGSDGETSDHFPFGFVQLAPNRAGNVVGGFPPTRWAQTTDIGYVPNSNMPDTFMAVAIDLPDFNSPSGTIHPTYKQDVASRLVLGAMNVAYRDKSVVFQGPFPTEYNMNNGQHTLRITFDNGTGHLQVNNNNGFEICCASTTSECSNSAAWSVASIKLSETSSIQIDASGCHGNNHITGVRYLWKESPCALKTCALYDSRTQLPVPPFIKIKMFQTPGIDIIG